MIQIDLINIDAGWCRLMQMDINGYRLLKTDANGYKWIQIDRNVADCYQPVSISISLYGSVSFF